jgi:hypothetical protein
MNKVLSVQSFCRTHIHLLGVVIFLGYANVALGACSAGQLCNPLKSTSITEFLVAVIEVLLIFALPVVVFFIMYSGYLFVTASGDTSQIEKARTSLTWSIIGGVIVLGAQLIMTVVQNTVEAL